jgi:hypothetical protein
LLEFAALKYSLDKFADTTYGFPIEVETDCQALRDTVMSTNFSTTHARWLEAVMGHDIREIRHLPGAVNFVGDALSRKYTNVERTEDDGSAWSVKCDWFAGSGLAFDLYHLREVGIVCTMPSVLILSVLQIGPPVFCLFKIHHRSFAAHFLMKEDLNFNVESTIRRDFQSKPGKGVKQEDVTLYGGPIAHLIPRATHDQKIHFRTI